MEIQIILILFAIGFGSSSSPKRDAGPNRSYGNYNFNCPWMPSTNGAKPENAVQGGSDSNNQILFVARLGHEGGLIPGKLQPSYLKAYTGWRGKEVETKSYEVLYDCPTRWQSMRNGQLPQGAIVAGYMANGTKLYVGRAKQQNYFTVGWVKPNEQLCHSSYAGKEYIDTSFEVLVAVE